MGVHLFSGARAWACTWTRVAHMCACEYFVALHTHAGARVCVCVLTCLCDCRQLRCVSVFRQWYVMFGLCMRLSTDGVCIWRICGLAFAEHVWQMRSMSNVVWCDYQHVCIYMFIHIDIFMYIYTHVCTPNTLIVHEHVYLTMYTCIYSYILIYIYIHIYIYIYKYIIHTYKYKYIHTYICE